MSDDFIASLKIDWKEQDSEFESVKQRLAVARWRSGALFAVEIIRTLFFIAAGAWLAVIAWQARNGYIGLAAFIILFAAPFLGIARMRASRHMFGDAGLSPEETLRFALRRADAAERFFRIGSWSAVGGFVLMGTLWICAAIGWSAYQDPFSIFPMGTGLSAISFVWFLWQQRRNASEREQCQALLSQYDAV